MPRPFLLTVLAFLLAAAGAAAASPNPELLPDDRQQVWAGRLAEAASEIDRARARVAALEDDLFEARHESHPRGDELAALEARLDRARERLREALRTLPSLVDEARRAGVLPEVLRPYRSAPAAPDRDA